MRQLLELQPRGGRTGIAFVRYEVTPAYFDGVQSDSQRGQIHEPFRHGARDRMPNRPVLTHYILVLEHDPGTRTIVAGRIGTADEVDDLVGFDRTGARVHRIGTDTGEIVDLERH